MNNHSFTKVAVLALFLSNPSQASQKLRRQRAASPIPSDASLLYMNSEFPSFSSFDRPTQLVDLTISEDSARDCDALAQKDADKQDCPFQRTLGTYLAKGWKPDFSKNAKNSAFLQDQFDQRLSKGAFLTNMEGLGLGPRTKIIIQDAIQLYMDYYNAYYNAQSEGRFTQPELNRYLMYINFYRLYLEGLLGKIPEILTARSKDLTLSTGAKWDATRHQDIIEKFDISQAQWAKNNENDITNPKVDDSKKNEGMGSVDSFKGLILPFSNKVTAAFKAEWEGKEFQVGKGISAEVLNKVDNWNGDNYGGPALGTYLRAGWNPDFQNNTRNAAAIATASATHLHSGAFVPDMEGLGAGPKTKVLAGDIAQAYVNYQNAYYNSQQDTTLPANEKDRYLSYTNFQRVTLEIIIDNFDDILTARSKDLTQSSTLPFEKTRHVDLINQVEKQVTQSYKDLQASLNDPKSTEKARNEAMGVIDAYNGLATPLIKKVTETFKNEWDNKLAPVGKSVPQDVLSKPDNFKPDAPKTTPPLGVYVKEGWTPTFEKPTAPAQQAAVNQAVAKITENGSIATKLDGLGAGPKTKEIVANAIQGVTNYLNAGANVQQDKNLSQTDKARNQQYTDFPEKQMESLIGQMGDILTARSKDLTLNPTAKFEDTRHQDMLEAFTNQVSSTVKKLQDTIVDPKSTPVDKSQAQGAIDAYNGIVKPFIEKTNQAFKEEWDTKQAPIGKALNPESLKQPDNYNPNQVAVGAPLGKYLDKNWRPDFTVIKPLEKEVESITKNILNLGGVDLIAKLEKDGVGPQTKALFKEAIQLYKDYEYAYTSQNWQAQNLPQPTKYSTYLTVIKSHIAEFIKLGYTVFQQRSVDITQNPNVKWEDTRHQDVIEKFEKVQSSWIKSLEDLLVTPVGRDDEAKGAIDARNWVNQFDKKIDDIFRAEWDSKQAPVGAGLTPEVLNKKDNFVPASNTPAVGDFVKKGWTPDFTPNQKQATLINDQVSKVTHNGKLDTELESLGLGPKTSALVKEAQQLYVQNFNAYFNTQQDGTLTEAQKATNGQFNNQFRVYLEDLLTRMPEILTQRSKDLTQSNTAVYTKSRHEDILGDLTTSLQVQVTKVSQQIGDTKLTEKQRNEAAGTLDSLNRLIIPFQQKVYTTFKTEWEGKLSPVGKGITPEVLSKPDGWNGENFINPPLGNYLKKGWAPDFTVNQKNLALVTQAVNKQTHNGALITELEGLGLTQKSKVLVTEIISVYTNYYNAYFNAQGDLSLVEPERNRYLGYTNTHRLYLEDLLNKIDDILIQRSKDLTLSADTKYDQTRHEDILVTFANSQLAASKRFESVISDPKSSDKEKNEAMGAVNAYSGLIAPFQTKVNEVFKVEWETKQATVGKTIPAPTLSKPDNWSGPVSSTAPVAQVYIKSDWKPDFTPNTKNAPQVTETVAKVTHNGAIAGELETLGVGEKSRALINEVVTGFQQYTNAAYNVEQDSKLTEAEKPKYTMYTNFERTYMENLLGKMNETLTARSKDLTLNSNFTFDQTRHQDIIEKFVNSQSEWVKTYQATVADPKSTDKAKLEAQGAIDAYNGLIVPFTQKVTETFKAEWDGKLSSVGKALSPDTLKVPDNWNGNEYSCPGAK